MSLSYYQVSIPVFVRMLGNLSALLDKAAAFCADRNVDESVLLNARLAPDMFPLVKQVQIATDQAKGVGPRLAGLEPLKLDDKETRIDELKERIATAVSYLNTIAPSALDDAADKIITMPWMPDHPMRGDFYLLHFVLPNVYFHVTTAYAILRHNGVALGKTDYIGGIERP
ncbi:hypothetical protein GCM10007860_01390 [Chitiniphilus shinanonensis]|uniref:DUF1993 domain-containing protein n=1 Tax=Chitiniphilus shinanonensis TaxID=553088 RepID=A0ABQ6BR56_9NEIS|nr:DUF1993 domain-containing protein [Chitiniphilus shinanonensis]GLS02996.1 hypothetical protein GCM10007860_01390 [Chitiniphilus shinanonensis]